MKNVTTCFFCSKIYTGMNGHYYSTLTLSTQL